MRYGNPLGNGSVEQARKLYESIGLCYEHGQPFDRCGCLSPEQAEEWKALEIVVEMTPPEPETVGVLTSLAYGDCDLELQDQNDWLLGDMTPEQQKTWFDNIEPLEY